LHIYCSGIGGIGLSAYAALQHALGVRVTGSDRTETPLIRDVRERGIAVSLVQDGTAFSADTDLLVYSEAIPADAPERMRAAELGIRQISYFHALGELCAGYSTRIAVCGTHGKSTTTAMTAHVLQDMGMDPTVIVGTKVPALDGRNWRHGQSGLFLMEACEYRRSFMHLAPTIILLTNVDWDHVDAFPSRESYEAAFVDFVSTLPTDGVLVTHMQDPQCRLVAERAGLDIETQVIDADGLSRLQEPHMWGRHIRDNARLVLALCEHLGKRASLTKESLEDFQGCWRRMEERGRTKQGAIVVDDYAHHPTEILATVTTIREKYPQRRLICVFQPHMFDRTQQFYKEFTQAFLGTYVLLTDVYEARREAKKQDVDMKTFAKDIAQESGTNCEYVGSLLEAQDKLDAILHSQDVVLFLGAGDVTNLASQLVDATASCPS